MLIKGLNCIPYRNKDLAGDSAVWRARLGVAGSPLVLLVRSVVKEPPKMVLRRMMGPSLETDAVLDAALPGNYYRIEIRCR